MLEKFQLATLSHIDQGRINTAFEQELRRCEADCKDRPGNKKPRTVALVATMSPVANDEGDAMESCDVQFHVASKVPKRLSKIYNMKATAQGLLFNELSPDEVRQRTIDEPQPQPRRINDAR